MEQDAATAFWPYENGLIAQIEALQQTGAVGWFFGNLLEAMYNLPYALLHPGMWLDWSNKESLMRFIYFGASVELFFVGLLLVLVLLGIGFANRRFMWGTVITLEWIGNTIGRIVAWAGLLMVLQQILIIFMQRIFAVPEISIGFGIAMTHDVSWWAEELKFYNALIVALCVSYTFVQGGHVRVDLVYAAVGFRVKRIIDMIGSVIFMVPAAILVWMYGWFFLWRHLVVPKPSASDTLERLLMKSRALRWNVETIGFSPNGFNAYFLFKILLVAFTGLVLMQALAFFCRSYLELREGPESEDKHLDHDAQEPIEEQMHASEHLA